MTGHSRSSASTPKRILVPGMSTTVSNHVANTSSRASAARRVVAVGQQERESLPIKALVSAKPIMSSRYSHPIHGFLGNKVKPLPHEFPAPPGAAKLDQTTRILFHIQKLLQ